MPPARKAACAKDRRWSLQPTESYTAMQNIPGVLLASVACKSWTETVCGSGRLAPGGEDGVDVRSRSCVSDDETGWPTCALGAAAETLSCPGSVSQLATTPSRSIHTSLRLARCVLSMPRCTWEEYSHGHIITSLFIGAIASGLCHLRHEITSPTPAIRGPHGDPPPTTPVRHRAL